MKPPRRRAGCRRCWATDGIGPNLDRQGGGRPGAPRSGWIWRAIEAEIDVVEDDHEHAAAGCGTGAGPERRSALSCVPPNWPGKAETRSPESISAASTLPRPRPKDRHHPRHVVARDYPVEQRMLAPRCCRRLGDEVLYRGGRLQRPVSRRAPTRCARCGRGYRRPPGVGVPAALSAASSSTGRLTPSAGGPVVWPALEAIPVVPNNAHAPFVWPMVTSPFHRWPSRSAPTTHDAVVFCDGRRDMDAAADARCRSPAAPKPVKWIRLDSAVHRPAGPQIPAARDGLARAVGACSPRSGSSRSARSVRPPPSSTVA